MITSSMKGPSQPSGSNFGSTSGTPLSSKCRASRAKPTSSPSRLASSTHSWAMCTPKPAMPAPVLKPVNMTL